MSVVEIYRQTAKKNDQLWNRYVMRPLGALVVFLLDGSPVTPNQVTLFNLFLFCQAALVFCAMPNTKGTILGVILVELSYLFDCVDGMLARHKKLASKSGHLFDFFTDESKALLLAASVGVHLWRQGGYGVALKAPFITKWPAYHFGFLLLALITSVVVASALSLTNFVRRPEISGKETTVEAYYETVEAEQNPSLVKRLATQVMTFLRFLNHYPSHLWIFAIFGRLDVFLWMYLGLNGLYLARGWLGLVIRFGRGSPSDPEAN